MASLVERNNLYLYVPFKGPSTAFAVLFAISGAWHLYQCFRFKCFKITALHPFVCLLFAVGYAMREYQAFGHYQVFKDPVERTIDWTNLNIYMASTILIFFSPPLLELANYHVFGRILYYVPYFSPIHPGRTLTTFAFLSAIVEVLNALGVTWYSTGTANENIQQVGHSLLKASLLLQIAVIAFFIFLLAIFHRRCSRAGFHQRSIVGPIYTMYASTALIIIRCVYRTVEHFADYDHPTRTYEWYFWVFEAVMMALNEFLWNVFHPRRFLPERHNIYLAQDGQTELKGKGWKDERTFLLTVIDPFGCMTSTKNQARPFWEDNGYRLNV